MLRFTGEKMSKSLGNVVTIREAIDTWGRETVLLFFMTAHWSKPIDFSEETMAQAAAQVETLRNKLRYPGEAGDDWDELVAALDDDFNTPDALAILHRWRDRDLIVRALGLFGLDSLAGEESAPEEVVELARAARGRRGRRATSPSPTGCAPRSTRTAGRSATSRAASGSCASSDDRPRLRPPCRARGAARAAAGARAATRRERAIAAESWLRDEPGLRLRVEPERALTALAGTSDHQGVVARVEPYPYADADELARAPEPLLVCLDQVTDPRNLGAVARSAEGAGATGIVLPAHQSARVTPAVCRASAGAVEHLPIAVVPNLARYLAAVKGPALWVYGADSTAAAPMWRPT